MLRIFWPIMEHSVETDLSYAFRKPVISVPLRPEFRPQVNMHAFSVLKRVELRNSS